MSQFWKKEPFYRAPKIILHFGGTNIISADCIFTSTYVATTLIMMIHKLSRFVQQYYFFSSLILRKERVKVIERMQ